MVGGGVGVGGWGGRAGRGGTPSGLRRGGPHRAPRPQQLKTLPRPFLARVATGMGGRKEKEPPAILRTADTAALAGRSHVVKPQGRAILRPTGVTCFPSLPVGQAWAVWSESATAHGDCSP